jgi:hypothetical protein
LVIKLSRFRAAIAVVAFAFAGCASGTVTTFPAGAGGPTLQPLTLTVAGWYHGSIKEVEKSQQQTGYLTVMIAQQGSQISGVFEVSFPSGGMNLTLKGNIKSQSKKQVNLAFSLYDANGKRYATGTAIVRGTQLNGKAFIPAPGSHSIKATFKSSKFYPPVRRP